MWWAELLNSIVALLESGAGGGGGAFESIATATGTGSSGTITFSSIPSTYTHLQIRALTKSTNTAGPTYNYFIRFNSDTTAANYRNHYLRGTGSAAQAGSFDSDTNGFVIGYTPVARTSSPDLTNMFGTNIIDIHDYASTTKNKTVRSFFGTELNTTDGNSIVGLQSGLWVNTAAVSSLSLFVEIGNWTTSTVFSLYGIKGA